MTRCCTILLVIVGLGRTLAAQSPPVTVEVAGGTPRELRAKQTLEQVIATYDLKKYTFTRRVVIQEGVTNHAYPVLTLNVRFAASPDEMLSSYVHEQIHWHLRELGSRQQAVVAELRRLYPNAPVGLPEAAENEFSTYAHLVVCYLEIVADRELLGPDRAKAVIDRKPWYSWIYSTILRDEERIANLVDRHRLRVR
jgi:hypothetical protein